MATAGDSGGKGPQRAFVEVLPSQGPVRLSNEESHHLCRTRRVAQGERVVLFDGEGKTMVGRLVHADGRAAIVELDNPYPDREPHTVVQIAGAVPEAGRADHMIATLAEMGVTLYQPVQFARMHPKRASLVERRRERWTRVTREAAKVNGRSRTLRIGQLVNVSDFDMNGAIVLDPHPAATPLSTILTSHGTGDMPWLVIGPEGGLTPEETANAKSSGALFASLGATVLRIETAALAAAAIALGSTRD